MSYFRDFKKVDNTGEYLREYWDGLENMFVRYWTYFMDGLNVINEAKYLLGLLGIGLFKSDIVFTWQVLVLVVVVGFSVVCLIGRWNIFRANKAKQYIAGQHGSLTQFQAHNMNVTQTFLLAAIAEKIGVDIEKVKQEVGIK